MYQKNLKIINFPFRNYLVEAVGLSGDKAVVNILVQHKNGNLAIENQIVEIVDNNTCKINSSQRAMYKKKVPEMLEKMAKK